MKIGMLLTQGIFVSSLALSVCLETLDPLKKAVILLTIEPAMLVLFVVNSQ
jgi:hypothetical protein